MPHHCDSAKGDLSGVHAGSPEKTGTVADPGGMPDEFPRFRFSFTPAGLLLIPVFLYRKCVSPYMPDCCRFTPSCSVYAAQAILTHGACKGFGLAVWRILRCNPFCRGGYDPVPPKHIHPRSIR